MTSSSIQVADSEAAVKGQALFWASDAGNINEVTRLLGKKAGINYMYKFVQDGKEWAQTPLMAAVIRGHAEVAKFLIARKSNLDLAEPCHGFTALHTAAMHGNIPLIKLLMSKGAKHDARDKEGWMPLQYAARDNHKHAVACLVDLVADVNAADVDGDTALSVSAKEGHLEVVKCLVEKGADVTLEDAEGYTALHGAAYNGPIETVKFLVLNGADINKLSKDGFTPLHDASIGRHRIIEDYLIAIEYYSAQHGTVMRKCKVCGKPGSPRLQICGCCNILYYCGDDCRLQDWHDGHSVDCERLKAEYVAHVVKLESGMAQAKKKWKEMEEEKARKEEESRLEGLDISNERGAAAAVARPGPSS